MPQKPGKIGAKPKSLTVDFTGVERGGGGRNPRVAEGDYLMRIVDYSVRGKKGDPSKKHVAWSMVFEDATAGHEKYIGKRFTHRTSLSKGALFGLRGMMEDILGPENVPDRAVDIPLAKIVKKQPRIGASMVDDEFDDKPTSKIAGTFPRGEWDDIKAGTSEDEDEEEDEEEEELETEEEDDDEEESAEDEEEDEEDDEEDEDDDEEDEEEEPAPKKKSKKEKPVKKAKKEKKAKKSKKTDDDDEDEDDDDLDLDDL